MICWVLLRCFLGEENKGTETEVAGNNESEKTLPHDEQKSSEVDGDGEGGLMIDTGAVETPTVIKTKEVKGDVCFWLPLNNFVF